MNNPQYLPQQSQMYGSPGASYGAPSAGYPQQSASPRPPPTGAPAGFTSRGPQSAQPTEVYPPIGHQNGPATPQGFPLGPDAHGRNLHSASPGPTQNLLANQLAGMNMSGSPRPGSQTMGYPGGPPTKPGFTTPPPPGSAQNIYPPGSFPPAMNGSVPQVNPSLDQQRQLSSPYMNGSMPPTGPGRGPQGMSGPPMQQKLPGSPMVPPQGGPGSPMPPSGAQRLTQPEGQIIPPLGASQPQRQMPPHSGGPPSHPHPMGVPSQPGGPPPMLGGMPPQPVGPPSIQGGMPPQPGGPPLMQGGPPSMQGGMPPQPGGPPSMQGGMPPQPGGPPSMQGGMPPHPGGPPSMQGGMPPHLGGPPSMQGGMPPHPGGPPSMQGGMAPHPGGPPSMQGGMAPHPGGPPSMQGGMPPHPVGPPSMQGGMPPHPVGPPSMQGVIPLQPGSTSQPVGPPSHFSPREPSQMPPGMRISGPHGQLPPNVGPTPSSTGYMSGQQGHLGPPPSHIQQQQGPPHMPMHQGQMGGPPLHGSPMQPRPGGPVPPSMGGVQQGSMPQYPSGPHMPPPAKGYPPSPQDPYSQGGAGAATHMANAGYQHNTQPQVGGVYSPQQQQQARRLDPEQMPSPIQVMLDDQHNRSGVFCTNQKGLVPPLVTTNFVTQDQGNASPRYIRSSMYNVPVTVDMMKQTAVPFGLVISPLAKPAEEEYLPPIVDMGDIGPVRCVRCKAYMSPFMQFIDGGRRFHCLLCKATTEVPAEYFQHLDHTGQRVDRYERPELMLGAYEFVATKDYCKNNTFPKPPAMIFVIDVSYNNVKSGMVQLLCQEMKEILKHLPKEQGAERSNMKVGFITYNNTVHFYNVKGSLAQPQMMVVGDVQDMFMPLLDGFLCDPVESEAVIESLMEQIPSMFGDTRETETVLAPAIQAGLEALKASECAGKLLVFHSSLPIAEAPGKLKNRDDRKLLGTEKEKTVLAPQTTYYNSLGQDCVGVGCSVDLFIFNNSYIDLATIGQVSRLTGGEIFKYTYFQADLDGERLISDIMRNISRPIAFDAIMRVRTSTGVRATDFSGHFFMSNTMDMELASMDCDKAVAVEIKHDDKLTEEDGVYIQVALLYTSCGGQRRLRILNVSLKTCSQLADLYRSCDLDTIINFFAKQSITRLLETSPKPVKEGLINHCAQMLACYRKNCASPSSAGQLILPECMKLLLLYVNCILKSDAISGGSDMTIDDRTFVMQAVSIMDIPSSVVYFYPRLLPLHEIDLDTDTLPSPIRCSSDKICEDGVYLLENGIHMFLWIGLNVTMEWVQDVFGVHSAAQIDIDRTSLLEIDNPLSLRIRSVIETVREQRHRSMRLTLVRQRDKLETVFKHFLVEDRGIDGSSSYVDFLCHMHREIRNLLS